SSGISEETPAFRRGRKRTPCGAGQGQAVRRRAKRRTNICASLDRSSDRVRGVAQIVKRACRYRFHPTPGQAAELARTFGCVRLVYNKALEERTRAYRLEGRRVSYAESSAALTAWKRGGDYDFLFEVSSVPLQQALRHLQAAFANFFAKRAKYHHRVQFRGFRLLKTSTQSTPWRGFCETSVRRRGKNRRHRPRPLRQARPLGTAAEPDRARPK
ncbi:putative transposase, partial [Sinosporangium album]